MDKTPENDIHYIDPFLGNVKYTYTLTDRQAEWNKELTCKLPLVNVLNAFMYSDIRPSNENRKRDKHIH